VKLARPMSVVKVPATVQAVLVSRIDLLAGVEKESPQTLAVLEREFALNLGAAGVAAPSPARHAACGTAGKRRAACPIRR